MSEKIEELKKDIAEYEQLMSQATRTRIRDNLSVEIRKLSTELLNLQQQQNAASNSTPTPAAAPVSSSVKRYQVKLNNYAWDQTGSAVKFYVSIPKVHTIPKENVVCKFTPNSLELNVTDLENKDYVFVINNLLYPIVPETSNWKVKTDTVLINASKTKNDHWAYVTQLEKKVKDAENDKFKPDTNMDPNEGLMSLMKKMYEKGDDEMKRTIAKAWTENQNKSSVL